MHEAVAVGHSTVTEEDHELVRRLGVLARVVPERVGVLEVRLRVALLRVDEVRELGRVAEEENGGVVLRAGKESVKAKAGEPQRVRRQIGRAHV